MKLAAGTAGTRVSRGTYNSSFFHLNLLRPPDGPACFRNYDTHFDNHGSYIDMLTARLSVL